MAISNDFILIMLNLKTSIFMKLAWNNEKLISIFNADDVMMSNMVSTTMMVANSIVRLHQFQFVEEIKHLRNIMIYHDLSWNKVWNQNEIRSSFK